MFEENRLFLQLSWGSRQERSEQCAIKLRNCLELLSSLFERSKWKVLSRIGVNFNKKTTNKELAEVLRGGMNRNERTRQVIPDLGYRVTILPGDESLIRIVKVQCGSYVERIYNTIFVDFGLCLHGKSASVDFSLVEHLAIAMIEIWHPDHGILTSDECRDACNASHPDAGVGWMTYLSKSYDDMVAIPRNFRVASVNNGRLLILDTERLCVDDRNQMKAIKGLQAILEKHLSSDRG